MVDAYFRDLFKSSGPSEREIERALHGVGARLSEEDAFFLSHPFTEQEVKDALSSMSPLKSPGPDGYPALFFQKYWIILGTSVVNCILNFLNNHALPPQMNYTYIVLIPKVKNPKHMPDFCPISQCNVLLKIGTKAIANRFETFAPLPDFPCSVGLCPRPAHYR